MTRTMETRLKIASWDEKPYRELADGGKFSRAEVALEGSADALASASFEALLYYRADGTSTYVTLMQVTGTVGGRSGSFALQGEGTYDGTTARIGYRVIPGSGTDDLAGIGGTGQSVSTHADYPYMPFALTYDIE